MQPVLSHHAFTLRLAIRCVRPVFTVSCVGIYVDLPFEKNHLVVSADTMFFLSRQKDCVCSWTRDYMKRLGGREAVLADLEAHLQPKILWHDDRVRLMGQAVLASTCFRQMHLS